MEKNKKDIYKYYPNYPENQIGCGYCYKETECDIRNPKINKAKDSCIYFIHWETHKQRYLLIKQQKDENEKN